MGASAAANYYMASQPPWDLSVQQSQLRLAFVVWPRAYLLLVAIGLSYHIKAPAYVRARALSLSMPVAAEPREHPGSRRQPGTTYCL